MGESVGAMAEPPRPRAHRMPTILSTWANRITTGRAVGTTAVGVWTIAVLAGDPGTGWQLAAVIVATCCEILDGVDGTVARARGEASAFGARYDMEVDSVLLVALSFALVGTGVAGWWVLVLGGWRYAYWLGQRVSRTLRAPLPYLWSRRLVAVLVISAAIAALFFDLVGVPPVLITALLVAAAVLLTWSFGRDIVRQIRVR